MVCSATELTSFQVLTTAMRLEGPLFIIRDVQ
jgi:hypothetical protein